EILSCLEGKDNLFVIGCGGCAKAIHSGGDVEVTQMVTELAKSGKKVIASGVPERTCYIQHARTFLEPRKQELEDCGALVIMGCGGAVQVVRQATEEYGLVKPIISALNSIGHFDTIVPGAEFVEQCLECGDCVLNRTGSICPVTKCAKGLLNGPCGGSENGKCEVNPDRDCAWVLIYNRLQVLGELDKMYQYQPPKDYRKITRPRRAVYNEKTGVILG
ncbi:MAG TPA: methylenetetrahydrofolate reductase C-terminal domain-containing protein, partial [Spirochaetia bacterium]|nr:methylenetetrahydrofolate reductase C-terminal domain-containing protein [Spirochaetia bacterium]